MGLTVGSREIADTRIQGVALGPLVGSYELVFNLKLAIRPCADGIQRASISGARTFVTPDDGTPRALGFAHPVQPFEIACKPHGSTATPSLHLHLQPGQLDALEKLRGTGDLSFELQASGTGTDGYGEQHVQGDWRVRVPRSEWIGQLRSAGARNVMLLEVPIPLESASDDRQSFATELRRAEERYRHGDYNGCVAACRLAIDELGLRRFGDGKWANRSLKRFASDHEGMNKMVKDDREEFLCAALRHYTHPAHHGPGEGGVSAYTRAEAQFVLSTTAAVANVQAG